MLPPDHNDAEVTRFPPEYRHLEDMVQQTESRLQQLDAELAQHDAGPQPTLQPPGYRALPPAARRSKEAIQFEKDELKADTYKQVEKETAGMPVDLGHQLRDTALGRLYKEDIAKPKAAKHGLPSPEVGWELESKQVDLLNLAKEQRDIRRAAAKEAQPQREVQKQAATNNRDIERDR